MAKKKKDTRARIYVASYILVFIIAGITLNCYDDSISYFVMASVGLHLVFFAQSIIDTALVDVMLYKWSANRLWNRTVHAPSFIRKIFLTYPGSVQEVHLSILILQLITIVCTIVSIIFGATYAVDCFVENDFLPQSFYECFCFIHVIFIVGVRAVLGIFAVCLAEVLDKQEKKNCIDKKRRSLFDDIRNHRSYKQWQKDLQWRTELVRKLRQQCRKYKRRDHLLQEDMAKIEEQILIPYSKYIVFSNDFDEKGKRILTVQAKSDGKLIFQAPIKKH